MTCDCIYKSIYEIKTEEDIPNQLVLGLSLDVYIEFTIQCLHVIEDKQSFKYKQYYECLKELVMKGWSTDV